jgi:predicted amidohydrolase YtcJ
MAARLTAVAVALIVGVTLVAGLIVGAQRDDDSGPIDLLIYNGRVYTGDASAPFAEAVAIRGNRIYRVGSNREIKRLRRRATTVIDAHGGSVLPGFSDASARLPVLDVAPLSPAAPGSAAASGGANAVPPPIPKLDSPAVAAAGAPAHPGAGPAADAATPNPAREGVALMKDAIQGAHRLGVTGFNTIAEGGELEAYAALRRDDRLPLRVMAALRVPVPVDAGTLARLDAARAAHAGDPVFRVEAVALKVTLPTAPARPARRGRSTGAHAPAAAASAALEPARLPHEVQETLVELDRRGWNVVLQVEDERALDAALDGLSQLADATAPVRDRRHRVELARPMALDVARIKALGVAVSLPLPATWAPGATLVAAAATVPAIDKPGEADASAPSGSAAATPAADSHAGLRLLMASESLADPRLGLQALLTGPDMLGVPTPAGTPPTGLGPTTAAPTTTTTPVAEASLAAAIDAYTRTAAWASGDERRRGTIARDMLADIVILSADLFTLSADKLLDAVVTMTIFDGKVVYDRESESVQTEP